jgi:uncharacterized secreted protein with C-terminal beta-propeller domain
MLTVGIEAGFHQVSLYDLSNFANPLLMERMLFPTAAHESTALHDHKAFTYSGSRELLALPYFDFGSSDTGVLMYAADELGLDLHGTLLLGGSEGSISPTQRAVFVGDNIYGLSRCRITSAATESPSTTLDSVPIYDESTCPPDPAFE